MELTEEHIDLLEKEHFGTLTESEKATLNSWEENPEFVEEAVAYRSIFKSIDTEMDEALKSKMEIWEDESKRPASIRSLRSTMKYAAIMLGFMISIVFVQKLTSKRTNPVQAFYKTYPNTITTRGSEESKALAQAMELYEKGQYEESILKLKKVEASPARDFYLGQCYFGVLDYSTATMYFSQVVAEKNMFKTTAEWYLQLSLLKTDKKSAAEKNLQRMVDEHHEFADDAEALLLTLRKTK